MAAIVHPRPEIIARPHQGGRPDLRVIHGGRSASRQAYRRRRLVVALLALLVAVGAVAVGRGALARLAPPAPAAAATAPGAVVVVRPGDTIWSIARRLHPRGDVRALVDRLAAVHGQGPLLAGERLPVGS